MPKRPLFINALHLFALCSFAVAQPLYDLLAQNVEFFIAHRAGTLQIVLIVAVLSFGLPLVLTGIEALVGVASTRARQALHLTFVALLIGATILISFNRLANIPPRAALGATVVLSLLITLLYARSQVLQRFCTIASLAALFFPLNLLFLSPVSGIVFPAATQADSKQASARIESATPVVMVVLDEFNVTALLNEKGEIDAVRYPNFAALAGDAWWFRRATTIYPETTRAVPAILTGRLPPEQVTPPSVAGYPDNLFTLLGPGYRMNVSETITEMCPQAICPRSEKGPEKRFDVRLVASDLVIVYLHTVLPVKYATTMLPPMDTGWNGFSANKGPAPEADDKTDLDVLKSFKDKIAGDRGKEFSAFVDQIQGGDKTLDFIHILLPHDPYVYLPNGKTYPWGTNEGLLSTGVWSDNEHLVALNYQRFLLQAGFVDTLLGELIAKLKQAGKYDPATIVLLADHGKAFKTGVPKRRLVRENGPDLLHIPLFVKLPGQREGKVSDRPVSNLDVLPTIADALKVKIPWKVDGVSMVGETFPERGPLSIRSGDGSVQSFERSSLTTLPLLPWQTEIFGTGTPLETVKPRGPHPELIGRSVESLPLTSDETDLSFVSEAWDLFRNVDLNAGALPVSLQGEIRGLPKTDRQELVAVAVNGVVEAVTPVFTWNDKASRISTMISPQALRTGDNRLEAFALRKEGGDLRFTKLKTPKLDSFELVRGDDGAEVIVSSAGRKIQVVPGKVSGAIDQISKTSLLAKFRGWAADVGRKMVVTDVLLFVDGRFAYAGPITLDRPDVGKLFNAPNLVKSGYIFGIPSSLWSQESASVRVFGVTEDGFASELPFGAGAKQSLMQTR